ncbi:MAG TPA: hypothetical protein VEC17_01945 [Candidatus Binatia bacterium]|nr:hypothetical protein [Candidatus Binatia bacterium]
MAKFTFALALTVFIGSFTAQGQQTVNQIPLRDDLVIMFGSAPGAPDLPEMFSRNSESRYAWDRSRSLIDEIQFAFYHLYPSPDREMLKHIQGNTFPVLVENGAFHAVSKKYGMKTAIQVAAIKEHSCFRDRQQYENNIEMTSEAAIRFVKNSAVLNRFDIDTAMGHKVCSHSRTREAELVARWSMDLETTYYRKIAEMARTRPGLSVPPVSFCDIEPYPYIPIDEHILYIARVHQQRILHGYAGFECYDLDIDVTLAEKTGADLVNDFARLVAFARPLGIKVGVIINGDDSRSWITDNDHWYFQTTNYRLIRFKELGLFDMADRVAIMSWAKRSPPPGEKFGPADMPRNLPETDANTHTNYVLHVLDCIRGVHACSVYPHPR